MAHSTKAVLGRIVPRRVLVRVAPAAALDEAAHQAAIRRQEAPADGLDPSHPALQAVLAYLAMG